MSRCITLDQARELSDFFSGRLASDMGIRSSLGPQLDRLAAGITGKGNALADIVPSEHACEAVVALRRIERTLRSIPVEHARVLRDYYTPRPLGELDGLELFGLVVGIVLASRARADLRALIRTAKRHHGDAAGRQARESIHALIGQAEADLRAAWGVYASADKARRRAA